MQDFDWEDVKVFLSIHETGSFSQTAKKLGMTQPTVSRKVSNLENKIESQLFSRSTNGVELTSTGAALLPAAQRMASSAHEFQKASLNHIDEANRIVRITAPNWLALMRITPQMKEFSKKHPNISIHLNTGMTLADQNKSDWDLSLQYLDPADKSLIRLPICWIHYSYFASRTYIEEYGSPENIADLLKHRIIRHSDYLAYKDAWNANTEAISTLADQKLIFESNSSAINLQAVRSGLGITTLPTAAAEWLPELEPLPLGQAAFARLYLYYSVDADAAPQISICKDWLQSLFIPKSAAWFGEDYFDPYRWRNKSSKP